MTGFEPETTNGKLNLGALDPDSIRYVRTASPIFGMGLIEAIDTSWMLQNADPTDKNNDGISGRIGYVDISGTKTIAKFGAKATVSSVREQTLIAAKEDLGLSQEELGKTSLNAIIFYSRSLAPPAQRNISSTTSGSKVFQNLGCSSCHIESAPLGKSDLYTFNKAEIHPFSDFLLHNMGKDLADPSAIENRDADEFKTAPLWGLGLRETVNGSLFLLHDGRAHTINEAILLHGGEAKNSKLKYQSLPQKQKDELLKYLNNL